MNFNYNVDIYRVEKWDTGPWEVFGCTYVDSSGCLYCGPFDQYIENF